MSRRGLWLVPLVFGTIALFALFGMQPRRLTRLMRRLQGRFSVELAPMAFPSSPVGTHEVIAAMTAGYLDSLLRGNAGAFAASYHDDGIAVPGTGGIVRGRGAIEKAMAASFSSLRFIEADMSTIDLRLSGETAVETGHYRFLVNAYPEGVPRTLLGRYAIVWKRLAGEWRIILDVAQPNIGKA